MRKVVKRTMTLRDLVRRGLLHAVASRKLTLMMMRMRTMSHSRTKGPKMMTMARKVKMRRMERMKMMTVKMKMQTWMMALTMMSSRLSRKKLLEST
jgi:hypothetical protein